MIVIDNNDILFLEFIEFLKEKYYIDIFALYYCESCGEDCDIVVADAVENKSLYQILKEFIDEKNK
jgi:hypothetical protein